MLKAEVRAGIEDDLVRINGLIQNLQSTYVTLYEDILRGYLGILNNRATNGVVTDINGAAPILFGATIEIGGTSYGRACLRYIEEYDKSAENNDIYHNSANEYDLDDIFLDNYSTAYKQIAYDYLLGDSFKANVMQPIGIMVAKGLYYKRNIKDLESMIIDRLYTKDTSALNTYLNDFIESDLYQFIGGIHQGMYNSAKTEYFYYIGTIKDIYKRCESSVREEAYNEEDLPRIAKGGSGIEDYLIYRGGIKCKHIIFPSRV